MTWVSVLWCINTGISEFLAKSPTQNKPILWKGTIYLGMTRPTRVRVEQGISFVMHNYQYISFGRNKQADFMEGYNLFMAKLSR